LASSRDPERDPEKARHVARTESPPALGNVCLYAARRIKDLRSIPKVGPRIRTGADDAVDSPLELNGK
jgi:hypothetical protein